MFAPSIPNPIRLFNDFVNRHFIHFHNRRFDISLPVVCVAFAIWFYPLRFLHDWNYGFCENYFPDRVSLDGGFGKKVYPFAGRVVVLEEATRPYAKWWRHLQKFPVIH